MAVGVFSSQSSPPLRRPFSTRFSQLAERGQAGRGRSCVLVMAGDKLTVLVTGAAGRTGRLVLQKLVAQPERFTARALVHTKESASKVGTDLPDDALFVNDVVQGASPVLDDALAGADALVIATSAVPKMQPPASEGARPEFYFPEGQFPEQVDWEGQRLQIDAASAAGVKKVVLISSMGGTQPNNQLNKIANGNILVWKRRAEEHLMQSGLDYTIVHPGGLIDEAGGERELVVDVDDKLLEASSRSIPRADVAEFCVQALTLPEARNRSLDLISRPPGEGTPTTDFAALFASTQANCSY